VATPDLDIVGDISSDALGASPEALESIQAIGDGTEEDDISRRRTDIVESLRLLAEKLEGRAKEVQTIEVYLELSDVYLALGTLTKDNDILKKAADAADDAIKIREKDRPLLDKAEQNKRAALDRIGGYYYSNSAAGENLSNSGVNMFGISTGTD
jgi:hypothetical protein